MSTSDRGAEMLPGLRSAVKDSAAKAAATRERKRTEAEPAAELPVARVLVDLPLAHLDRPFDYLVPAGSAEKVRAGVRVKVRFAGQDVDGFVLERVAESEHAGRLQPLRRVVSPEPVLAPEIAELAETLADRFAGTRADVLRLAVPPRHARTEAEESPQIEAPAPANGTPDDWLAHPAADAFLGHLAQGGAPRAVWATPPGADWPALLAHTVAVTRSSGRGALVCVPDHRDVTRLGAALDAVLGPGQHVVLTADSGPAARYRAFLAVARGAVRVAIGTRAAAYAPVHDLGLVAMWDDGDDLFEEPRAPYAHTRDVLLARATQQRTALLLGAFGRSVPAQQLLDTGWAHELSVPREEVRRRVTTSVAGASESELRRDPHALGARIPTSVHALIKEAVAEGPVLVQVPRGGYAAGLACDRCHTPARCEQCQGPLQLSGPAAPPTCGWCGRAHDPWSCGECGGRGLRAPLVGDLRTAEELGRAFPAVTIRSSSGEHVVATVPASPAIVVATPGAEPVVEGGYAGVVLLDGWVPLARSELGSEEEALRRWLNAAGMARAGSRVELAGVDPAHPVAQALVRWDPAGLAQRQAALRREAHLPPGSRMAVISGDPGAVDDALTLLTLPPHADVLGPIDHDGEARATVLMPRGEGATLTRALHEVQRVRSARKLAPIRVQVDPPRP